MADNEVTKLIHISIEMNMIKQEMDLTMTFVRDHFVGKMAFNDLLSLPDGYGK